MRIKSGVVSGYTHLARLDFELSREAAKRLKWFDYYYSHGCNARLTCRYFGISPQTFYRWKRRYDPRNPDNLEDRSHRPKHLRQPTWSPELAHPPEAGKDKLCELLRDQGRQVSASMVGRILRWLKESGVLKEPVPNHISTRKRLRQRPFATRKPREYPIKETGDIVQLDTLDLRPLPGVLLKHFTAHDVVSKWNVMSVHRQANPPAADRRPFS
jgi:transposase